MLADLVNGRAAAGSSKPHIQNTGPAKWRCLPMAGSLGRTSVYLLFEASWSGLPQEAPDSMPPWTFDIICKHNVINLPVCNSSFSGAVMSRRSCQEMFWTAFSSENCYGSIHILLSLGMWPARLASRPSHRQVCKLCLMIYQLVSFTR